MRKNLEKSHISETFISKKNINIKNLQTMEKEKFCVECDILRLHIKTPKSTLAI